MISNLVLLLNGEFDFLFLIGPRCLVIGDHFRQVAEATSELASSVNAIADIIQIISALHTLKKVHSLCIYGEKLRGERTVVHNQV